MQQVIRVRYAEPRAGLEQRRIRVGRDWAGAVVRTRRRIETMAGVVIPAGVEARVVEWVRGHGVRLRTDPCPACGLAVRASVKTGAVVYLGHETGRALERADDEERKR